jgi:hypothetical protein
LFYVLSERKQGYHVQKEFVCDSKEDLEKISDCSLGDLAIVVYPATIYLRNSKEQWLEL